MVEKVEPAADRSIHSELSHVKTVTLEGVILQFSEMTLNLLAPEMVWRLGLAVKEVDDAFRSL